MPKQKRKVPISSRALVQRINRALAQKHGKIGSPPVGAVQLKKTRASRAKSDLGEYYELDIDHNFVRITHVDIEEYGRELKCLDPWEVLDDEEAT